MIGNKNETKPRARILFVDDDEYFTSDIISLMSGDYDIFTAATDVKALELFETIGFDAVLLDIDLGKGMEGFDLLDRIHKDDPCVPVIMVTKDASSASAVSALKRGASDYIDKKPDMLALEKSISAALELQRLAITNRSLRRDIEARTGKLIGESLEMSDLRREIQYASQASSPVLIMGETGTGKELVAREIHKIACPSAPFVAINCAAVPRDLFEARLFGNERGAFTGAGTMVQGVFELASDGILFLDEITEIEPALQAKLLRVIEEREFERIGGNRKLHFKGKILASSNENLKEIVAAGSFRKDLYYRFSTFILNVPPLRARRSDIALLVDHFLRGKSAELKKPMPIMDEKTMLNLCAYDWPGNVRELENAIEAFIVRGSFSLPMLGAAPLTESGIITDSKRTCDFICNTESDIFKMPYQAAKETVLADFKKKYLAVVLAACGGDVHTAARRMEITRFGLQKIIKETEK